MKNYKSFAVALLFIWLFSASNANAAANCENAEVLSGKLISDICWDCMFPIRVAGFDISGDGGDMPDDAVNDTLCACEGPGGVPSPGFTVGMWQPAYLVETTRTPGCALSMNGTDLGFDKTLYGTEDSRFANDNNAYMKNYHYYRFPLLQMLSMQTKSPCLYDGATEFDAAGFSEVTDPVWYSDDLAFFANPEVSAVANPVGQVACGADSAAVNAGGKPSKELFWCAGSWGSVYPFSGEDDAKNGIAQASALQSSKVLATNHRRGFMHGTVGNKAMCGGDIQPMFPKQQYKYNMFWPRAEKSKSHQLGQSDLSWGMNRTIPITGEDQVYVVYRWTDCCYRNY